MGQSLSARQINARVCHLIFEPGPLIKRAGIFLVNAATAICNCWGQLQYNPLITQLINRTSIDTTGFIDDPWALPLQNGYYYSLQIMTNDCQSIY